MHSELEYFHQTAAIDHFFPRYVAGLASKLHREFLFEQPSPFLAELQYFTEGT